MAPSAFDRSSPRRVRFGRLLLAALVALSALVVLGAARATGLVGQPAELGTIAWGRDLGAALAASRASGKPVLVLFDEIPGCSTVRSYGERVLSHPLLDEAAETLFEPVAIYNNVPGPDRDVLRSFGEPAWNNPVVRIVDAERAPLAPRVGGDHSVAGLAGAMVEALTAAGREVPAYLRLLAAETRAARDGAAGATFSMACFWSGEAALGAQPGVVATRTGFRGFREVVDVTYDPDRTDPGRLAAAARRAGVDARSVTDGSTRPSPDDDKYHLARSSWRHVPLTPAQASRVNAALARRAPPEVWVSPRQRRLQELVRLRPALPWPELHRETDLAAAFARAGVVADRAARR